MNKEITFESIREEKNVDELYRMRHELVKRITQLHEELHSGNVKRHKTEILGDINLLKDLEDYAWERIPILKKENYFAEKEMRGALRRFKEVCRIKLPDTLFRELEMESKKSPS